jgi:hypothetical protein
MKTMKSSNHSTNLNRLNRVRSIIAKARCLEQLEEGNLLGALLMARLMIKFKISSLVS